MNFSPVNKNLLFYSFYIDSKISPNRGISLTSAFNPKLINNLLASFSLINFDFYYQKQNILIRAFVLLYLSLQPLGFYILF